MEFKYKLPKYFEYKSTNEQKSANLLSLHKKMK